MSERFLKWAIRRHFRALGCKVRLARIRLGNTEVDGEVEGKGWKMALEIKTPNDDLTRGLGQLAEAVAFGYKACALVTTLRRAKRVHSEIFDRLGLILLGVDSKGQVHEIYPTYTTLGLGQNNVRYNASVPDNPL
jgi:hypothetical protein